MEDTEELAEQQRAALRSSGDAWRTAAVMTCFLLPFGPLFGGVGLSCLSGLGAAIDGGREGAAENKLRRARTVVLIGTVLGGVSLLAASFGVVWLLFDLVGRFVGAAMGQMRG